MKTVTKNPPDFPANLPLLPEPAEGKKWEYRGVGWSNNGNTATYICSFRTDNWDKEHSNKIPCGDSALHYAELVDEYPDVFSKEYQAELAKQWVLEGGFEREVYLPSSKTYSSSLSHQNSWNRFSIYRRKPQPTQEELDRQKVRELSKDALRDGWNPHSTIEAAIATAIQYGRETK